MSNAAWPKGLSRSEWPTPKEWRLLLEPFTHNLIEDAHKDAKTDLKEDISYGKRTNYTAVKTRPKNKKRI